MGASQEIVKRVSNDLDMDTYQRLVGGLAQCIEDDELTVSEHSYREGVTTYSITRTQEGEDPKEVRVQLFSAGQGDSYHAQAVGLDKDSVEYVRDVLSEFVASKIPNGAVA